MLHTTITNNNTAEPASSALHSSKMVLQQNAKLQPNTNHNTVYKVNTSHEHNKNGNIYYNDYLACNNGGCSGDDNNSKLKYVSSSVPRNANDFFGGDNNTSALMSSKKKKNKRKQNNNFFDIEFLPYNHFYIERERKKKERKNQFEGLIIIKKISQSNIIEAESLYNNHNMYPRIKLKFDGNKNSNYNSINAKPISSYRKNKFAFNNNKNNSVVNNSSSNAVGNVNIGNNNISNSINTSKQSVVINHEVIEKKKQRMEKVVKNYYTDEKPLTTCGNMSRSHNNALVLGLNKEKDKDKENMNNVSVNQKYTYKYKVNSNNNNNNSSTSKVVNNSNELKKSDSHEMLLNKGSMNNNNSSINKKETLKHSASSTSCGYYTRYQNTNTKTFLNNSANNNNNNTNTTPNNMSILNHKQTSITHCISPKTNPKTQNIFANTRYSHLHNQPQQKNYTTMTTFKPTTKSLSTTSQSIQLKQSPPSHTLTSTTTTAQKPITEPPTAIQLRKEIAEKQSINFKDFKSLLYVIVPGNASYLVKNCMCHRINWKETFSLSSSLFNFKWQQISYGIDFCNLSRVSYLRQMVNHFEYHTLISNKANMFANLFKWCEDRNVSVFKYVPFTIVHKILKEDKDNQNELKQKKLEEFINGDMCKYVKDYEHIGVVRSFDATDNYADYFQWLHPSNKQSEADKAEEEANKGSRKDKVKDKKHYDNIIGKHTRIEIPVTHWVGKNMWVVKAVNLNRGQCIRIVDSYQKMEKIIKMIQEGVEKDFTVAEIAEVDEDDTYNNDNNNNKKASTTNNNVNNVNNNTNKNTIDVNEVKKYASNKIIIQKYIESPLLYKGRKCDMRIWALLTHKMKVYVFKEGHLKTCSVDYNINSQDAFTHITNYSFQKYSNNFAKFEVGNEVPFHDFQTFINEAYPTKHYSVKDNLMTQVKEIIEITMKCAKTQMNINKRKYSFEIFGYDFMLDSDFNLFLIEINTNPGLEESSPWIKTIVPRMLDDALRLTIDMLFNTRYDHAFNYKKEDEVGKDESHRNEGLTGRIVGDSTINSTKDDNNVNEGHKHNDKSSSEYNDEKYVSPFPVPGYNDDENLWEYICDLNDKDEYELKLEQLEKEKQMKKERDKAAFYTGIKHLIHKRKSKKTK